VERIPGLGDIPVVGHLFRSTAREGGKTNLMVFIRPTIVRSTADARAITAPRYEYIRDQQAMRNKQGISELDQLVREYLRAAPPTEAPSPAPSGAQLPAPR
jgi:general secretion pathway protein D